jgi:3-hydroxyanthranilate 3,4-dioxygenase
MIIHGPNTRLNFYIEPADEFFYQVLGNIELHLKPEDGRREVVKTREGEMLLCPGDLVRLRETEAMINTAEIIFAASRVRQESRLSHIREDYPERDDRIGSVGYWRGGKEISLRLPLN